MNARPWQRIEARVESPPGPAPGQGEEAPPEARRGTGPRTATPAQPGFAVDFAGIPLKKGEGKKSARLSILPLPKAHKVHVPTPDGSYDLPWITAPIPGVALAADPADLGATPRRMVHAHVVSTTVL